MEISDSRPDERFTARSKPAKCPRCGLTRIARIQYGLPAFTPQLERDIEAGRVVLGGCIISGDDPAWACKDCHAKVWMIRRGRKKARRNSETPDE